MKEKTPPSRKYRVLYAVTRPEYYEIEAPNKAEAEEKGFLEGMLVRVGDTTDVVDCETVRIKKFSTPRPGKGVKGEAKL